MQELLQKVQSTQRSIVAGETVTRTQMLAVLKSVEDHLTSGEAEAELAVEARITMAMKNLSYSEELALSRLMPFVLADPKGLIVASKIADAVGITRSVIVNTLRKLESAGVIWSQSLGMKGTIVKILMPAFAKRYLAPAS